MNPFHSILETLRKYPELDREVRLIETWLEEFHKNAVAGYVPDDTLEPPLSDPTRSHPDYFYAVSRKYTDKVFMILPLRNGDFALFNAARRLVTIVPAGTPIAEISEKNIPVPVRRVGRPTGASNLTPTSRGPDVEFEL